MSSKPSKKPERGCEVYDIGVLSELIFSESNMMVARYNTIL